MKCYPPDMTAFNPDCIEQHDPRMAIPLAEAGAKAKSNISAAPQPDLPELFSDLGPALARLSQAAQAACDTLINQGENLGKLFRASAAAYRQAESTNQRHAQGLIPETH